MEFTGLSQILPFGFPAVLLLYLLKVLVEERRFSLIERSKFIEEIEKMKLDHAKELKDKDDYWRRRCEEAERKAYGIGEIDGYP